MTTPPVGGTGTVMGTNPGLAVAAPAQFTLVVNVNPGTPNGTVITNTTTVTSSAFDPTSANNAATSATTVGAPAPTPQASIPNAAMPGPGIGSPLLMLGFVALLIGALSGTAVLAVRRVRT